MEGEYIAKAAEYVAYGFAAGVAVYAGCKYALKPLIDGTLGPVVDGLGRESLLTTNQLMEQALEGYHEAYSDVATQRRKAMKNLLNRGKPLGDITDFLDKTLPFPEKPDLDCIARNSQEPKVEPAPVAVKS